MHARRCILILKYTPSSQLPEYSCLSATSWPPIPSLSPQSDSEMPEQMLACAYMSSMPLDPPQVKQSAIDAAAAGSIAPELDADEANAEPFDASDPLAC